MAKPVLPTPAVLSANRIQDIAKEIYNTCATGNMDFEAVIDAKNAVDEKAKVAGSKREEIMTAIALLSIKGSWIPREVDLAAKSAITYHNNVKTEKAMETFIGEIKHAAHPAVRAHVPLLIDVRNLAWQAETEQLAIDKAAPQPLRKCFKRSYHALIRAMGACEAGQLFRTVDDMVDFAIANDPDQDAAAVYKKIAALQKTLAAYFVDYPADDLGAAADTLGKLTFNDLKLAQDRRLADSRPVVPPTTVAATPPTTTVETPPATVVVATPPATSDADKVKLAKAFTATTVAASRPAPIDQVEALLGDNLELKSAA